MIDCYLAHGKLKSVRSKIRHLLCSFNNCELETLSLAFGDMIDCSIGLRMVKDQFPFLGTSWGPPSETMHELFALCDLLALD